MYQPTLAEARRDAGLERVRANDPAEFQAVARQAIVYLADRDEPFTSDDIRELVTVEPHHVNGWGSAVAAAVNEGLIVNVGYRKSQRPEAHARVVAVYRGAS